MGREAFFLPFLYCAIHRPLSTNKAKAPILSDQGFRLKLSYILYPICYLLQRRRLANSAANPSTNMLPLLGSGIAVAE